MEFWRIVKHDGKVFMSNILWFDEAFVAKALELAFSEAFTVSENFVLLVNKSRDS
jgi:hypothetical protein